MTKITTFQEIEKIINNEQKANEKIEKIGKALTKRLGFEIEVFEIPFIDDKTIIICVDSAHINITNDLSITILNPEAHNIANSDLVYVADGNNDILYTVDDKNNNEVIISKQKFIELMNDSYNEKIINKAKELNNNVIDIIDIYNNYCSETNQVDNYYYSFENPKEFFNNKCIFLDAWEAVRAVLFGEININHNIITFDGYGNLISMTKREAINEIIADADNDFIDYVKEILIKNNLFKDY